MSGFHLTGSRPMARSGAAVTACTARIKPAPVLRLLLTVVALANRTPRSLPA